MSQTAGLTSRRLEVFLSNGFLVALGILLLNDFCLKATFHNGITGKLSDFAGLFAISVAISATFPRRVLSTNICLFFAFVLWKTPLADSIIEAWNFLGLFAIGRTVDYTDYVALLVLPFASLYVHSAEAKPVDGTRRLRAQGTYLVIVISVFAFGATTMVKDRTLTLSKGYAVREKHSEIEAALRTNRLVTLIKLTDGEDRRVNSPGAEGYVRVRFYDFLLAERTCDSDSTEMSIMIREYPQVTNIESVSINFECREYESHEAVDALNQQYLQHAAALFEKNILKDLHAL